MSDPSAGRAPRVVLAVFPHPDDESFGPSPALVRLLREGHAVHLLTLTRGEATRERERLGLSLDAMGDAREAEMHHVVEILGLTSFILHRLPDGALADLDPRAVEAPVADAIARLRPDVVVTYPVHGISGHPDHLVTHAAVKRVVVEAREDGEGPKRLAFFCVPDTDTDRPAHLRATPLARVGVEMGIEEADIALGKTALDAYVTYAEVVRAHDPLGRTGGRVCFELFGEAPRPVRTHLLDGL